MSTPMCSASTPEALPEKPGGRRTGLIIVTPHICALAKKETWWGRGPTNHSDTGMQCAFAGRARFETDSRLSRQSRGESYSTCV